MTRPLIDRASLRHYMWSEEILDAGTPRTVLDHVERTTDAAMDYLREVLSREDLHRFLFEGDDA